MRLLCVSHWSFGRDQCLLRRFHREFEYMEVRLNRIQSDPDLNRTVVTFLGDSDEALSAVFQLAEEAFERIDLNRHVGSHPRIGALDDCVFVVPYQNPDPEDRLIAQDMAELLGQLIGERLRVPVYLHQGEESRREAELIALREAGFGGVQERVLDPDFGPKRAHERCGVAVIGARDPFVAFWARVPTEDLAFTASLSQRIEALRAEGDERFIGVEASAMRLPTRSQTMLSVEMTLPDLANADPVIEWLQAECRKQGFSLRPPEPVGGVLFKHLDGCERLRIDARQIIVSVKPKLAAELEEFDEEEE